jgi:ABC-type nickel/cobalt efflux system permease component RcnA
MSTRDKAILATVITIGAASVLVFASGLHLTGWQGFWILAMIYANRAQARYFERERHERKAAIR